MARPRKGEALGIGAKTWRKWVPKAWLSDTQLRLCSPLARSLWIDMLNIMMESVMCGYLVNPDRKAMPTADLATVFGQPVEIVEKLLAELKSRRVYSVDNKGRIFSRRIVREENEAEIGAKAGKEGIENRERDQQGRLKPWTNPGVDRPARERERDKNKKEEGAHGFLGAQASRTQPRPRRPWTLDEKRQFGWKAVAKAIGDDGWEIVSSAADGNTEARRICKAKAKDIGVTWYDGKPELKQDAS